MSDPRYSFGVARFAAITKHQYLATAYMALTLVEGHLPAGVMGTMGVDKRWRLYADPNFWERPLKEQTWFLYHEIWHLLRNHHARMETFAEHPYKSNVAFDCEINDDVIAEIGDPGVVFPACIMCQHGGQCSKCRHGGTIVYPKLFGLVDGKMAEEYYHPILKWQQNCKCVCHSGWPECPCPCHQHEGNADGFPNQAQPGGGHCGSCASGKQQPWELPQDGSGADGESKGISDARGDLIRHEVAQKIREACKQAETVPEGWRLWAESFLDPKVNWRRELAALVRRALSDVSGMLDFTYRRPNRRDWGDVIMPALRKPVPEVAVVADTSGSMGGELDDLMAEVAGILKVAVHDNGVPVLCTDAQVHTMKRVFRPQQVELLGGGGTDMGAGILAASGLKPKPHICVVLTDCYTPWGESNYGMKVIVAHIGGGGERPPWAHKYVKVE